MSESGNTETGFRYSLHTVASRLRTDSLGRAGTNVVKPGERFTVTGGGFPDEDPTSIVATIA